MKPGGGGEELVGVLARLEEHDEALELGRVLGTDVGGLADEVLCNRGFFCYTVLFVTRKRQRKTIKN